MDDDVAQTDIGDELQLSQPLRDETQSFTEHVTAYFSAYVSGELSASGLPRRIYNSPYLAGLLRQLPLDQYPQLHKNVYKNFVTGLNQQTFVVAQNKYVSQSDEYLLHVIENNISKLAKKELLPLLQAFAAQAEARLIGGETDSRDAVDELLRGSQRIIAQHFIVPFVLPIGDIDIVKDKKTKQLLATLEDAAASRLYNTNQEVLRHIYTAYFASMTYVPKESLVATLEDAMTPKRVKDSLERFAEDLHINDAYQHIYALHRSTAIDDRLDMYVYFGELQYDSHAYPLFYTKVTTRHTLPSVTVSFENKIFINKQAIEYVVRHFAARTNQHIDISTLTIPHAIHTADQSDTLQQLVTDLSTLLKLPDDIKIAKAALQETTNQFVTLTNRLSFYLDTTPGSSIADDYASITENSDLQKKAGQYLGSLLSQQNLRFVEEISETWAEKSHFDKLLPTIPMPVNDEQQQVLIALGKAGCERIVIDSGDATGKKHLVGASILASITKGESVLVVGNSPAAAERIHQSITQMLRDTSGRDGHSPVLNLHNAETLDHIDDQVIADVSASATLVESKLPELAVAKKRKKQALKDNLVQLIQNAENINLHEVEQTVYNERRFAGRHWIEDEPIEDISMDMQHLHRAIQYVRSSEAGYLMPYIEGSQQKAIEDFIAAYKEYEKASKNVNSRLPEFIVRYRKLLPDQKKHLQESLAYIQSNYRHFMKILKEHPASNWMAITENSPFSTVASQQKVLTDILDISEDAGKRLRSADRDLLLHELDSYAAAPTEIIEAFDTYVEQIATLKSKLFGFSGRVVVVENLNKQLLKSLPSFNLPEPEKQSENMQIMSDFVRYTIEELAAAGLPIDHWRNIVHILLARDGRVEETEQIVESLNQTARFEFVHDFKIYEADNLLANITLLDYATELNRVYKEFPKLGKLFGITAINHLLARPHEFTARVSKLSRDLNEANQLDDAKQVIKSFAERYPAATKRLGISYINNTLDVVEETFADSNTEYIKEYIAHKKKEQDVSSYFSEVATDSFGNTSVEYRQILGVELQYAINTRLLQFAEQQSSSLQTISTTLKERRKLSTGEAASLIELFPCVVGEVHLISDILPLVPDMFDLVIIDTADSLSIAEVLPAILRAKRVLLVGDSKQTTRTSLPVYSAANAIHAHQLSDALRSELRSESADNKNSIIARQQETFVADISALQFYTTYANYTASFKEQYGVYEELASFANKYYYDNSLVSLMSRAAPLAQIISFSATKPTKDQVSAFTNVAEVEYIIQQLHTMKEQGFSGTIGIVTPFAEQAALLQKELDECVITDWFKRRDLRVMTFDSKRHHARDYTFYSLVASSEFNELSQVLPSTIGFDAFDGDVRSERLLTGFSGNRHAITIVHSLPLDEYGGSLSETLKHFNAKLLGPTVKVKGAATDILLATEANINQAFEKTHFARKYKDRLSFITKYPFVNYIKPFSPQYFKAAYKVFFLIMIDNRPIVIEFDDFKERFLQNSKNDKDNGGIYLTTQDIYGYKLLEGYDYRFLRLNKFTIGSDPSHTLDMHLSELIKTPSWPSDNGFVA